MKRKITIYLGLLLSIVFIILIVKIVDFKGVITALRRFNLNYIAPLLILYLFGMIIRAIRWRMLISQHKQISFNITFSALATGFMVNNVLPAKMGELVRAEYIAREGHLSRGFSLGTVFAERMMDVALVLIFLFGSIFFSKTLINLIGENIWFLAILISVIGLILLVLISTSVQKHLIGFLPVKYQKFAHNLMQRTAKSVSFLSKRNLFFKISFLTLLIWLGIVFGYYMIFKAMGAAIPLYGYFIIVAIGSIGMVIPSTSANIGVYDAIVMSAIMLFTIDKDKALAIAAVAHAFDIIPSILLGTSIIIRKNISILDYWRKLNPINKKENKC